MKQSYKILVFALFFFSLSEYAYPCTVATTGLNFSNYDTMLPNPLNTTGSVTVACDPAPPAGVTISIGPSTNTGVFIPRGMKHTSLPDLLNYNLYIDSAGTVVWGDGSAGTQTVFLKKVKKKKKNKLGTTTTIYGIIPPLQNVSVGSYSDILIVTITW